MRLRIAHEAGFGPSSRSGGSRSCVAEGSVTDAGTMEVETRRGHCSAGRRKGTEPGATSDAPESRWQWLRQTLRLGGPGQVIFAINNSCNASCEFCGFALDALPRSEWKFVNTQGAMEALDVLHGLFIRYVVFTGGEPLLHPELDHLIAHARRRNIRPLLVTNGSRLTVKRCNELVEAGVSSVFISVDAANVKLHERHRRLPGVCEKIRAANARFREAKVQVTASVTISRLIDDYQALGRFLRDLGFDCVTFSYPLTTLRSSFLGAAQSPLVQFSPQELGVHFAQIKALKSSFPVVNPRAGIEEMERFLRGEAQHYECLGGSRYFYLDWNLMVWRCHFWEEPMCPVAELNESHFVRDGCTRCMIDCFRDSSVMQHTAVNVADSLRDLRAGRFFRAFDRLWRMSNVHSLAAALENRKWIAGL